MKLTLPTNTKLGILSLLAVLFVIFGGSIELNSDTPEVKGNRSYLVTKVIDGDTIELEGKIKVRYIGIDTPETVKPATPVECFGKEASNRNKELVLDRYVYLEKDVSDTDRYGRLLRYVYVDGLFVNEALVREGYAHSASFPPDIKHQNLFTEAERNARQNNIGLWKNCVD